MLIGFGAGIIIGALLAVLYQPYQFTHDGPNVYRLNKWTGNAEVGNESNGWHLIDPGYVVIAIEGTAPPSKGTRPRR